MILRKSPSDSTLASYKLTSCRHGIFRLTHPPGLGHILECTHTATFHQHSIDNIYTDAQNPPGHVIEHKNMDFTVQDLRPKR